MSGSGFYQECPTCRKTVALKSNGMLRHHLHPVDTISPGSRFHAVCDGTKVDADTLIALKLRRPAAVPLRVSDIRPENNQGAHTQG